MRTVAVIGLGKQANEDHIPALQECDDLELVAVCDIQSGLSQQVGDRLRVRSYYDVEQMLAEMKPEAALLALPHDQYLPMIRLLANNGVHIFKEKPFAINLSEAIAIHEAVKGRVFMGVTLQRRFNPIYQAFPQMQRRIGKIFCVEGRYTLNLAQLSNGWRASKALAGGGALIDMGYHLIDLIVWYFGLPSTVTARTSLGNRPGQRYDVEDTASVLFDFSSSSAPQEKMVGSLVVSRVYPVKNEQLIAYGTKGYVELQRGELSRFDLEGKLIEKLTRHEGWPSALVEQLMQFAKAASAGQRWGTEDLSRHIQHVAIIEAAYESDRSSKSCSPARLIEAALTNQTKEEER